MIGGLTAAQQAELSAAARVWLKPLDANANPVFLGEAGVTVNTGAEIPKLTGMWVEDFINLQDVFVIGTNTQKISVAALLP